MFSILKTFRRDGRGATAIEYGLIAAGVSVAILGGVASVGSGVNTAFCSVSSAMGGSADCSSTSSSGSSSGSTSSSSSSSSGGSDTSSSGGSNGSSSGSADNSSSSGGSYPGGNDAAVTAGNSIFTSTGVVPGGCADGSAWDGMSCTSTSTANSEAYDLCSYQLSVLHCTKNADGSITVGNGDYAPANIINAGNCSDFGGVFNASSSKCTLAGAGATPLAMGCLGGGLGLDANGNCNITASTTSEYALTTDMGEAGFTPGTTLTAASELNGGLAGSAAFYNNDATFSHHYEVDSSGNLIYASGAATWPVPGGKCAGYVSSPGC